jgi:hypothetical protein
MFARALQAETLAGDLMPFKCRNDDKKAHTRECALLPECRATGLELALADGTFIQFDLNGSERAAKLLEHSTKVNDLVAEATGTRVGPLFRLKTIRLK